MSHVFAAPLRLIIALGFGVVILISAVLGYSAYNDARNLAELTTRLKHSTYTVAITVRDIENNTIKMHRSMKDVALASDAAGIQLARAEVDAAEKQALELFGLLAERYLGAKEDVEHAKQTLLDWRPIRAEMISSLLAGDRARAVSINQGRAAAQVRQVEESLSKIKTTANGNANRFQENAEAVRDNALLEIAILLGATIAIGLGAGLLTSYAVRKPIDLLRNAMGRLAENDLQVEVPFATHTNEIGSMAKAVLVFSAAWPKPCWSSKTTRSNGSVCRRRRSASKPIAPDAKPRWSKPSPPSKSALRVS